MKAQKLTIKAVLFLLFLVIALPDIVQAAQKSVPVPGDRRIRQYTYQPDTVYEYIGHYGYQSRIDLDPNEDILTISMGDSTRWDISPIGHRLFIKPKEFDATTNMTVITSERIYYFELYAQEADGIEDEDLVFAVRFVYGDSSSSGGADQSFMSFDYGESEIPDFKKDANKLNFNYTITGSRFISPLEVFDNGEFTYFKFKDINADLPALFQVVPDGNEALINFRSEEGYIVVEMVTSQFTLRYGDQIACVFNESMPLPKVNIKKKDEGTSLFGFF